MPPVTRLPFRVLSVVLAVAMIVAPTMKLLGELHESVHDGADSFAAHTHDVPVDRPAPGEPAQDDDSDLLHALSHASHCCSHSVAIMPASPALALMPTALPLLPSVRESADDGTVLNPFRPPISA